MTNAAAPKYFVIYTLTLSNDSTSPELEVVELVDADPFRDIEYSARGRLAQLRQQDSGRWLAMSDPHAFSAIARAYCGAA